jgi:hypothetical protein
MRFRRNTTWHPLGHPLDHDGGVTEGTVELRKPWLGDYSKYKVVAVRVGATGSVVQLRPIERPRIAAVVSNADYGRLSPPARATVEVRSLNWSELVQRAVARLTLPVLALIAAALAFVASFASGPSAASTQHAVLRGSIQTIDPALRSLINQPAVIQKMALPSAGMLATAEHDVALALRSDADEVHALNETVTLDRNARSAQLALAADANAASHDAAVASSWRSAALAAGGSTDDSLTRTATEVAAFAALAAAAVAAYRALRPS